MSQGWPRAGGGASALQRPRTVPLPRHHPSCLWPLDPRVQRPVAGSQPSPLGPQQALRGRPQASRGRRIPGRGCSGVIPGGTRTVPSRAGGRGCAWEIPGAFPEAAAPCTLPAAQRHAGGGLGAALLHLPPSTCRPGPGSPPPLGLAAAGRPDPAHFPGRAGPGREKPPKAALVRRSLARAGQHRRDRTPGGARSRLHVRGRAPGGAARPSGLWLEMDWPRFVASRDPRAAFPFF